jgi:CNT family concentrative nucleoside transporter
MVLLLISSVVSIPLVIALCQIVEPDETMTNGSVSAPYVFSGSLDAISKGTSDGLSIFLNIISMMVVMAALISLMNQALGLLPFQTILTLQHIMGFCFAPIAWLMGIPWNESMVAGQLLGTKTVLNEVFALIDFAKCGASLSVKTKIALTVALSSFANFASIGITVAGISAICPEKRDILMKYCGKSLVIGGCAVCLTGAFVSYFS